MATRSLTVDIPIDRIREGDNVRIEATDVASLAASIRQLGILQPITVIPSEDGEEAVDCLFGHRRLAAARVAGLATVPCIVRGRAEPATRVLAQLAENMERLAMTPVEVARSYQQLAQTGMSQAAIAAAVGTSQSEVSRLVGVLDYPVEVQQAVHERRIAVNDALAIPLNLARRTSSEDLQRVMRQDARGIRGWVYAAEVRAKTSGEDLGRRRALFGTVNLKADLLDQARVAARRAGAASVGEWISGLVADALGIEHVG